MPENESGSAVAKTGSATNWAQETESIRVTKSQLWALAHVLLLERTRP